MNNILVVFDEVPTFYLEVSVKTKIRDLKMALDNYLKDKDVTTFNFEFYLNTETTLPVFFTKKYDNITLADVFSQMKDSMIKVTTLNNFNNLTRDELVLIAMQMDLPTLTNFCKANKQINDKVCKNESFWKNKTQQDFPRFINRQKSFKDQYHFLFKILTRERFEEILSKPDIASELIGVGQDNPLDVYDLLYTEYSDHSWGVIRINIDWNTSPEDRPKILSEFIVFKQIFSETELDSYKEGKIGRMRSFLEELKKGKFHDVIANFWEEYARDFSDFSVLKEFKTADQYIQSLLTLEDRFQQFVIENSADDVRKEIKKFQADIDDDIDKALYNNDQVEFLQILHDGIKSKKLSLFDPVDYDFLMAKLTK